MRLSLCLLAGLLLTLPTRSVMAQDEGGLHASRHHHQDNTDEQDADGGTDGATVAAPTTAADGDASADPDASAATATDAAATPAGAPAPTEAPAAPATAAPRVVRVSVDLRTMGNVKITEGTYTIEGDIGFTCVDHLPNCPTDIESDMGDVTQGEPDVTEDGTIFRSFKFVYNGDIDMSAYPFDDHDFGLRFQPKNANVNEVVFEREGATPLTVSAERMRVPGWALGEDAALAVVRDADGEAGPHTTVDITLNYRRHRLPQFLKAFLTPIFSMTFLMILLLLRPKSASTRLTTAGGNLTAVATQHIAAGNQLGAVGYLTQSDKFFYFAYVVVLMHIIIAVSLIKLDETKNEAGANRLYNVALVLMPALTLTFIALTLTGVI